MDGLCWVKKRMSSSPRVSGWKAGQIDVGVHTDKGDSGGESDVGKDEFQLECIDFEVPMKFPSGKQLVGNPPL